MAKLQTKWHFWDRPAWRLSSGLQALFSSLVVPIQSSSVGMGCCCQLDSSLAYGNSFGRAGLSMFCQASQLFMPPHLTKCTRQTLAHSPHPPARVCRKNHNMITSTVIGLQPLPCLCQIGVRDYAFLCVCKVTISSLKPTATTYFNIND